MAAFSLASHPSARPEIVVVGAIYHVATGVVRFFD
jgi:hypothetical protein